MLKRNALLAIGIALISLSARPAPCRAQDDDSERLEQRLELLGRVAEDLERGLRGLEQLGDHDAMRQLARTYERVREERGMLRRRLDAEDHRPERPEVEQALELFRLALPVFREAGRRDAADMVERALHAIELTAEGHLDEAKAAHEGLPSREAYAELMAVAERLYREFDVQDRAERVRELRERVFGSSPDVVDRPAPRIAAQPPEDMETALLALHGLREANRDRAARMMARWLEARQAQFDDGTEPPDGSVPTLAGRAELLTAGADAWDELGQKRRAATVRRLAERYRNAAREERARQPERPSGIEASPDDRMAAMEARIREMRHALDRLQEELHRMRGNRGDSTR